MKPENKDKLGQVQKPYILVTWKEIGKMFPMNTAYVANKYGKEMLETGAIFKSKIGMARTAKVWTYPELIRKYVRLKAQENKGWI